jgi:glycosyltransferase involved in cell wall biosynthesis
MLLKQTDIKFQLIIIDNHSDYNVKEVLVNLINAIDHNFTDKLRIVAREENIGMSGNICDCFSYIQSGWMWLLSDDDVILEGSVAIIKDAINSCEDNIVFLKFPLLKVDEDKVVENIHELIDYYSECKDSPGSFIFLSNNVYNMSLLKGYRIYLYEYAYTQAPHMIPLLFMLNSRTGKLKFVNKEIVKFSPPAKENRHKINVFLGLSTISHINIRLNLERSYFRKLLKMFGNTHYLRFYEVLLNEYSSNKLQAISLMYHNYYKYILPIWGKIQYKLLYFLTINPYFRRQLLKIANWLDNKFKKNA